MRLLLRCDATAVSGVGHLMRCLAVAEEAARRGWMVALSGSVTGVGWIEPALRTLAVQVLAPADTAEELATLAGDVGADVVWIDHYDVAGDLHAGLQRAGALMVSVSDGDFGLRAADIVV